MAVNRSIVVERRLVLSPQRDERLGLYVSITIAASVAALLGGGLRLMVVGVPFAIAAMLGTRRSASTPIAVRLTIDSERCVEGAVVDGRIDVNTPAGTSVEIMLERTTSLFAPPDDSPWAWSIPVEAERPAALGFSMRAERWGRSSPGRLLFRIVDHGSLLQRQSIPIDVPEITVLPRPIGPHDPMPLGRPYAGAGVHRTRLVGAGGYDFAELRDYQPGDRLRDLNWAATLRRDHPSVNQRIPERSGNLVVAVDSFPDALRRHSQLSQRAITLGGRLAWSLARSHLAANDRVAFLAEGAQPVWLPPQSGRRANHAIFGALLRASHASIDAPPSQSDRGIAAIPADADIVAISPLARPATIARLLTWRASGHAVHVIALDIGEALRADLPKLPEQIGRLRQLLFDEQVAALRRQGIRVVVCRLGTDHAAAGNDAMIAAAALRALERRMSPVGGRR